MRKPKYIEALLDVSAPTDAIDTDGIGCGEVFDQLDDAGLSADAVCQLCADCQDDLDSLPERAAVDGPFSLLGGLRSLREGFDRLGFISAEPVAILRLADLEALFTELAAKEAEITALTTRVLVAGLKDDIAAGRQESAA